ncbi:MAG TPA: hypothetical protein VK420_19730 [Longimicrobium sp.]|nr:hypothetical protein [Longimicrobium sp.]
MSVKGVGGGGSSNSAAAAEAAQRRAEEAAQRAAAAAEARRQAAEAARKEAEAARRAAEEAAKQAAEQAKKAAEEAQKAQAAAKKATEQQAELEQNGDKLEPEEKQAATDKVEASRKDAVAQIERAEAQQKAADKAQQDAIRAGDKAIQSQKAANEKAKAAGVAEPFQQANEVKDTYEAARLDPKAQEKLLGTSSPVSPRELARHDAQQVQTRYDESVRGGEDPKVAATRSAEHLRDLADKNQHVPGYTDSLINEAKPQIDRIAQTVGDRVRNGDDDDGDVKVTEQSIKALNGLADRASPQGALAIGQSIADKLPDQGDLNQFDDAFGDIARDGGSNKLAGAVLHQLQASGKGAAAEEFAKGGDEDKGFFASAADKLGDVAGAGVDFARGAANFAKNTAEFAGDVARTGYDAYQLGNRVLGNAAELGGRALLEGGKNVAQQIAKDPIGSAKSALNMANELANAPRRLQQAMARQALEIAKDPVGAARGLVNGVRDTAEALNVERQIGRLGPNDSYKLSVGADGSLAGAGVEAKGNVSVTRGADGKYTVAADGSVGAGALSELGAKGAADAKAKLMATGGAKVEFKFDNAEDAEKATRTLMGGAGAASALLSGDNPLPDPGLLARNVSALELNAGAAGELSASLGLNTGKSGPAAGLDGSLSANAKATARIEFNDGKPDQLVLKQSLEVGAKGSAGLSPQKDANGRATTGPGAQVSAGGKGTLEIEERFDIPEGLGLDDLKDPAGAVEKLKDSAIHTGQITATLKGQVEGSANASLGGPTGPGKDDKGAGKYSAGGALEAELKLTGKVEDVLKSGGLDAALQGDFSEAMRRMAPVVKASGSVTPVVTSGPDVSLGGGVAAGSLSVNASATLTDKRPPLLELKPTSVDQLNRDFQAFLAQQRLSSPLFAGA